jgi:hypothetical protein
MDLASFQHRENLRADRLDQPHVHIGVALGVFAQELGEQPLDQVRRGRHAQHARVTALQPVHLLSNRLRMAQQSAAMLEHLRAFAGEQQPPSDPIEQLDAELALEVRDLARQRWLGDVQMLGCLGHRAEVRYRDESPQFAQFHGIASSCLSSIKYQNNYRLDA